MEIKIVSAGGKKVNALLKGFTIMTDQSQKNGGEGSAPEPFDLFLASIGTCAGIYVVSFCQERGIPTDNITLIMRPSRNSETSMVKKIALEIQLPPDFPEKYKKAVIRVADLCTVKKHLLNPPEFEIFTTS